MLLVLNNWALIRLVILTPFLVCVCGGGGGGEDVKLSAKRFYLHLSFSEQTAEFYIIFYLLEEVLQN